MNYVETISHESEFIGFFNGIPLYGNASQGYYFPLFTIYPFVDSEQGSQLMVSGIRSDPYDVVKNYHVIELNGYACMYVFRGVNSVTIYSNDSRGLFSSFMNLEDGLFYADRNSQILADDFSYPFLTLEEACNYFYYNAPFVQYNSIKQKVSRSDIYSVSDSVSAYDIHYNHFLYVGILCSPICCYPNFIPIVQSLGGIPVTDQLQNLKIICQLLGIDINTTLSDCDAMKEYLKRIVTVLGGTSSIEPNENLKSICYLLGVDTAENGLSDCALSKDYVKRNGIMLGAENA
ncbi:hypothetical protein [Sulfurospirillum multivorans]|uniref:Uncharacterized protein n=1 Tax=Sulfurospirillum multivorans TaxID=66821 RepID=A0ABX5Z233_SULMU|nr:hypothetical protein [Sulfurospirillum multivorans]QEH06739.1 hypothetical protein SMN_1974 [Sulfurospirillum multivorans]